MTCAHCQTHNGSDVLFCRRCGTALRSLNEVECENHTGTSAAGICVICSKPVCDDCSIERTDLMYCDDISHSQLTSTHMKIASTASEFEADLVAKNLAANGIPTLVFSVLRYSQFCRFTDIPPVSLYVEKGMRDSAGRIMEEMDLKDFLYEEQRDSIL